MLIDKDEFVFRGITVTI